MATVPAQPTFASVLTAVSEILAQLTPLVKTMADNLEKERTATDRALKPREVAERLGVARSTVQALVKAGRIKTEDHGNGLWRVRESELAAYQRRITGAR